MPPLTWNEILSISEESITDETGDILYEKLLSFNPGAGANLETMGHLFRITRGIMHLKGLQAEVSMEELEEMAKNHGRMSARNEKELVDEISHLQEQLNKAQGSGNTTQIIKLQMENEDLRHQNELMKNDIRNRDSELDKTKLELGKIFELAERTDKERESFKDEVEQLQTELQSLEGKLQQMDVFQENKGQVEQELSTKIKAKNSHIRQLMQDLKHLKVENENLTDQVSSVREKLEEAVIQMEKTTEDYIHLKTAFQNSESLVKSLESSKRILTNECNDLRKQLNIKSETDNNIMVTVSKHVEEWKNTLVEKEEEIEELHKTLATLRSKSVLSGMDMEQSSLGLLTKALEERDHQIAMLRDQLEQATQDLRESTVLLEDLSLENRNAAGSPLAKVKHSVKLQTMIREQSSTIENLRSLLSHAEDELKMKDVEMSETLSRMRLYEMGEYGLSEAVAELKECKSQIRLREKQIEDLTQQLNIMEFHVSDTSTENDALRAKLQMEPKPPVQHQYAFFGLKTKTRKLQDEVDKLDEENIELQNQVYRLQKAINKRSENIPKEVKVSDENSESKDLPEEFETILETVGKVQVENSDLRHRLDYIYGENECLHHGMKEILEALREQDGKTDVILKCPSLEQLVQAFEVQDISGSYDPIFMLKSQLDTIRGQNDALRQELKSVRNEAILYRDKLRKFEDNMSKEDSKWSSVLGIHSNSRDHNGIFIENATQTLTEDSMTEVKDTAISPGELLPFRPSSFVSQQEFLGECEQLRLNRDEFLREQEVYMQERTTLKAKVTQYETILSCLDNSNSEVRRTLSEMSRKMAGLHISDTTMSRKVQILEETKENLMKENHWLQKSISSIESQSTELLTVFSEMANKADYRVKLLQKTLENSVPSSELETANRKYTQIASKYREILDSQDSALLHQLEQNKSEGKIAELQLVNGMLKTQLDIEKQKVEILNGLGSSTNKDSLDPVQLKMRLATEEQKAETNSFQLEQIKISFQQLNQRNTILEKQLSELTQQNISLQSEKNKLEDQFTDSATGEAQLSGLDVIKDLEETVSKMRDEISEQKMIADIARKQAERIDTSYKISKTEVELLRKRIIDMELQNEEFVSFGALHRKIIGLQLSEATLTVEAENNKKQLYELEAQILQLQQKITEKDEDLMTIFNRGQKKNHFLVKVLYELRRKYASAIPLWKQEELVQKLCSLRKEYMSQGGQMQAMLSVKENLVDEVERLKTKLVSIEEFLDTIKNGSGNEKILEWHQRMEIIQLREVHAKRSTERAVNKAHFLEQLVLQLQKKLTEEEKTIAKLEKSLREVEMKWDLTEIQLEPEMDQLTLNTFVQIPDIATTTQTDVKLKDQETSTNNNSEGELNRTFSIAADVDDLNEKISKLSKELSITKHSILMRDQVISDLRSRIPTNTELAHFSSQQPNCERPLVEHYETKQSLRISKSMVTCLQARLTQKDEGLLRYQELLAKLRAEMISQQELHDAEIKEIQETLLKMRKQEIMSMSKEAEMSLDKPSLVQSITDGLVTKVTNLEETLLVKEYSISSLTKKILESEQTITELQVAFDSKTSELAAEILRHESELSFLMSKHNEEILEKEQQIEMLKVQIERIGEDRNTKLNSELSASFGDLEKQIDEKRIQLQQLNEAVLNVKSEMDSVISQEDKDILLPTIMSTSVRSKIRGLEEKNKMMENQRVILQRQAASREAQISNLNVEIEALNINSEQKDVLLQKVSRDCDELRRRFDRQKHISPTKIERDEIKNLQDQVKYLEKELELRQPAERPFDESEKEERSREEFARWEESKRWQQNVERLKSKVKDKEREIDSLEKSNKGLREQVIRLSREETLLVNRVKALSQRSTESSAVLELKKKVSQLEEKLEYYERQDDDLKHDEALELNFKNKVLMNKVADLEKELAKRTINKEVVLPRSMANRTRDIFNEEIKGEEKMELLQRHVLKFSEENFELKVECEKYKIETPNLRLKISSLEALNSALKADLCTKEEIIENLRKTNSSDIQQKNSFVQKPRLQELDNQESQDCRPTHLNTALSPSTKRLLDEKVARVVSENKRLQQDLRKCLDDLERLRHRNQQLGIQRKEALDSLEEKKQEVASLRKQLLSPQALSARHSKTSLAMRVYEERVKSLEKELQSKITKLSDMRSVLHQTALKEEALNLERDKLIKQLEEKPDRGAPRFHSQNDTHDSKVSTKEPIPADLLPDSSIAEKLLHENAELRVELRLLQLELKRTY